MFVAQGDGDHVIPRELLDRTWSYLVAESGAPTIAQRRPGGHQFAAQTVHQLGDCANAPGSLQDRLYEEGRTLDGVDVGPSRISVPGARGFTLAEGSEDEQAYLVPQVGEFAHLHPAYDGSLHLVLPADLAADVSSKVWGRHHMWAGTRLSPGFMMVYGPRDDDEFITVLGIVRASHAYASGVPAAP